MRKLKLCLLACSVLLLSNVAPAFAENGKVFICHRTNGANPYVLISVGSAAYNAHIAHGDVAPTAFYPDANGDGFGDVNAEGVLACNDPGDGSVSNNTDCDDTNANVSPVGVEECDQLDNDCDGLVDEDDVCGGPDPECTGQTCETFTTCNAGGNCGSSGVCGSTAEGGGLCVNGATPCSGLADCVTSDDCADGAICFVNSCCVRAVCVPVNAFCSQAGAAAPSALESLVVQSGGAAFGRK
ncbi:MAG: putative metal-binding motif-containing protein [Deltaproteobacteria bacterium]|nr:putative metal-binding motif-containing protein [Deltaproteobacteria bacterium]